MAAFLRHGAFKIGICRAVNTQTLLKAGYASKWKKWEQPNRDRKIGPKIDSSAESLAAKGFLRAQKEYSPPADVSQRLQEIFQQFLGTYDSSTHRFIDNEEKFLVLEKCSREFEHSVPNSLLHAVETVKDVERFYKTSVNTVVPYDALKSMDLPENLHVQFDYHRFHPETDTMFGGVTAFPRSSTLVTGLKYKNKYQGHTQRQTWPYNEK